jgi:predicted nucleic acid-binding protein
MIAIDTNVLIYSLDKNNPAKESKARALIRQLRASPDGVLVPWQVVGEFLRFLRMLQDQGRLSRHRLERIFLVYRCLFPIALPTTSVLDQALSLTSRYSLSHWDSMLLGACLEAGIIRLYTEDMGAPVVIDGIELINPFK